MQKKYSRIFYVCKLHRTVFLTLRPSQVQVLGKEKKSLNRLFFLWSRRQDSPSAAAAPCILMARRPSQATVPVSPLLAKNSPPDCFLNAQTFSGSSPWQRKKEPQSALFLWSRRQDLNLRHLGPKRIYDGTFRRKWLFPPLSARKTVLFGALMSTISECS